MQVATFEIVRTGELSLLPSGSRRLVILRVFDARARCPSPVALETTVYTRNLSQIVGPRCPGVRFNAKVYLANVVISPE
jgi:hypothetical protein